MSNEKRRAFQKYSLESECGGISTLYLTSRCTIGDAEQLGLLAGTLKINNDADSDLTEQPLKGELRKVTKSR